MMESETQENLAPGPAWLPQRWDPECPVHQHLMQAAKCLKETGGYEEASQNFKEAYQKHLQDLNRQHLGFSAIFPLFFASLRSNKDVSAACCGRAQMVPCEDHITDAFACCRSLLESVSSFTPDLSEPSEPTPCSRQRIVHELCSQAGIFLDMVRLGHVYRRSRRTLMERVTAPSLPDLSNAPSTPASSQLEGTPRTPGTSGSDDYQNLIRSGFLRAGDVLRSLQDHMDLLHGEVVASAASVKKSEVEKGQEVPKDIAEDGTIDPQLLTFANFLDLHLLPLYVRDMPLIFFWDTLSHFCGISLDEEDEIKARKVLGCPPKQKNQKKQLGKQISEASLPATPSSQGSTMEPSLRQILQASGQERKLRDQMSNSVVEKRRFGLSAQPDLRIPREVATPALAHQRKDASAEAAPSTPETKKRRLATSVRPTPRVSRALLMSPAVASPEPCPADASPVRWRPADAQRTEAPAAVATELTACWSAMPDTPWRR
mmetsp:Transcript_89650/g.109739  ORF Transcript_89650/g.109739 Transcript_89650/m.109739 type:complete len:488 (+) Transcript_89650:3-1466(+)